MDCPKCKSEMEFADIEGIRVERCLQCQGFWFNEDGHRKLRKVKGAERIDVGSPELGKEFDGAEDVPCPVCGDLMARVAEPSQPHIRIEACMAGHGVFFDAGEFKDFKQNTVGDLFKRLF
jgi:uncharacterized protein